MTKVFFDHQKISLQRYGGISRYFANVINAMKGHRDFEYLLGVLYSQNHYLRSSSRLPDKIVKILSEPKYAYKLNAHYCKRLLKQNDFDIFHPTYYDTYFLEHLRKPLVITVHDMTHERLPQYFWALDNLTYSKRLNIERADKIIAISETTRNDLIRYSDVDPAKIVVVYHGIDLEEPLLTKAVNSLPEQYLLFVGDRGGYKNFYLFIDAFKELSHRHPDLKVVLTGGGPIGIADKEHIRRLKLDEKVTHVNVTDEELNYLYQNALAFVYPSLHEGFGLPILEAYKASCPVLLSDTDCFREIAAEAAAFFHPYEKEDLISLLEKTVSDSDFRKELKIRGQDRLQFFSLQKSIEDTLDVYRTMA